MMFKHQANNSYFSVSQETLQQGRGILLGPFSFIWMYCHVFFEIITEYKIEPSILSNLISSTGVTSHSIEVKECL